MGRRSALKLRTGGKRGAETHKGDNVATARTTENETGAETDIVRDGFVLDFISGVRQIKETPKELVRQRITRALFHEYGISVEDMAADFPVPVGGRRRRVDIAIFAAGAAHTSENVQRVVVCRPEPKQNKRGAVKMRDYDQAAQDICDFDPFLIRASQMNMVMAGDGKGHLYHLNSLEFPDGHLPGVKSARRAAPLGFADVVMTNPPFGSTIPITDESILRPFELAHIWERTDDGSFRNTGGLQGSVAPEILFIERCLDWLRPGGRLGIVLPDGILGNPSAEYIRWWILRRTWVLASVDLPVETFIVEANVNILTSLLFLKKKPAEVITREAIGGAADYPIFMAVAEKVGFDRRGNTLYKRSPEGEEITKDEKILETITMNGRKVTRTLRRKTRIPDNDLPEIAKRYRAFRQEHSEPGE